MVLGYEWGGVVQAVGRGVAGLAVGTPVAGAGMGGYAELADGAIAASATRLDDRNPARCRRITGHPNRGRVPCTLAACLS
jgi:hypothetical protein